MSSSSPAENHESNSGSRGASPIQITSKFEWTAHPARERPAAALAAVAIIAVLGLAAGGSDRAIGWVLFATLILCLGLNQFFFPTYFTLDAEGITARFPFRRRKIRWVEIRRFDVGPRAGWLSTLSEPKRWEGRRGLLVLFGRNRAETLAQIRARIPNFEFL